VEVVTDPRRIAFALVAALIISGAISFVFYVRVAKKQSQPSTTRIIVAASPIEPGAQVTAEQLAEADWPVSVPLEGMIQKKEDVVGHSLIYAVSAKQPILQRDMASAMSYGLSAKIPSGMRATAVRTDEVANVAGFLFPGSHVDVAVSMPDETRSGQNVSRTVLQNVVVLSTGTKIQPDPNGKPEDVKVVTLLVTPEQSELLLLAQNQGRIQISLRNGDDQGTPDIATVRTAQLLGAAAPAPANPEVRHVARAAVKPAKPAVYTVETIAAGKVTTASFSSASAEQQ
jgi:pilus assembly protein CpaB